MSNLFRLLVAVALYMLTVPYGYAASKDRPVAEKPQITVIYDAFGKKSDFKKDWGYAALVEIGGKRILFDAGDNGDVFKANVKAAKVNLRNIDFVVLSHRHGDHMAGLNKILEANPKVKVYAPKEGFGVYGSSLPSAFYRKDAGLPEEYRYYSGNPPEIMKFGTAWEKANFQLIDQTTEIMPGIWLVALVSEVTGTKELKELALAIDTPEGIVLVTGCSHPGIESFVQEASKINPKIQLIAGGFHFVTASDEMIAKMVAALHDKWRVNYIAPGHCTGEPAFNALRQAFGDHYVYAGLGTTIRLDTSSLAGATHGSDAALNGNELKVYRQLAAEGHDVRYPLLANAAGHHHH